MFKSLFSGYDELWKLFVRPPRDSYRIYDLGPSSFDIRDRTYQRNDFELINDRGLELKCSLFEPCEVDRLSYQLPCVIYLHGNCSSRIEALPNIPALLNRSMCVLCFDFSGCGKSEGNYVSLGWFEKEDLACVVEYLRQSGRVSGIGLWGRSMGAVTALMYAKDDPSISAIVVDSPFSDITSLASEISKEYGHIPNFISMPALTFIRSSIRHHVKFDIADLRPMECVKACQIPIFFVTGNDDRFVRPYHSLALFDKHIGEKYIEIFQGDHNSARPYELITRIADFFMRKLGGSLNHQRFSFYQFKPEPQVVSKKTNDDILALENKEVGA